MAQHSALLYMRLQWSVHTSGRDMAIAHTYDGLRTSMCYDSCKCRCMYMTIGHGTLFTLAILRTHSLAMVKLCAVIIQSLSSWPRPYLLTQVPSTSTFQFTAWQDSSMSMLYNLFICMYITGVLCQFQGLANSGEQALTRPRDRSNERKSIQTAVERKVSDRRAMDATTSSV